MCVQALAATTSSSSSSSLLHYRYAFRQFNQIVNGPNGGVGIAARHMAEQKKSTLHFCSPRAWKHYIVIRSSRAVADAVSLVFFLRFLDHFFTWQVSPRDGLPAVVCTQCREQLDTCHRFRNESQRSQRKLHSFLQFANKLTGSPQVRFLVVVAVVAW